MGGLIITKQEICFGFQLVFSNRILIQWGLTTTNSVNSITLPLAYQNFYTLSTTEHTNFRGGREAYGINRTLNGWTCSLGYQNDSLIAYWNANTHWHTIGY